MPDLERRAVIAWLAEVRPDTAGHDWPPAIRSVETSLDALDRLALIGRLLDSVPDDALPELAALLQGQALDSMRAIMAQLGAARALRIVHWLGERDLPNSHLVLAALIEGDDADCNALRATLAAVTRRAVVQRLFSAERIAALEAACEVAFKEAA